MRERFILLKRTQKDARTLRSFEKNVCPTLDTAIGDPARRPGIPQPWYWHGTVRQGSFRFNLTKDESVPAFSDLAILFSMNMELTVSWFSAHLSERRIELDKLCWIFCRWVEKDQVVVLLYMQDLPLFCGLNHTGLCVLSTCLRAHHAVNSLKWGIAQP